MYTIMYSTDSPINIRSLFYVPEQHMERYGVRLEPGVSLFCRKVLIQQKAKGLLPEWLRFVKGKLDTATTMALTHHLFQVLLTAKTFL